MYGWVGGWVGGTYQVLLLHDHIADALKAGLQSRPVLLGLVNQRVKREHIGDTLGFLTYQTRERVAGGKTNGGIGVTGADNRRTIAVFILVGEGRI